MLHPRKSKEEFPWQTIVSHLFPSSQALIANGHQIWRSITLWLNDRNKGFETQNLKLHTT